jgi:hypothetical protein
MSPPLAPLQTGQCTCHAVNGEQIACLGSGQDAETRAGLGWPDPRFELRGDVVRDRLTGLIWSADANPAELPMTWDESLAWIAALNRRTFLGYRDWRLPNRRELRSLIGHQTRRPALPTGHPFRHVFPAWYWTSSNAAISPAHAWYVNLDGGRLFYGGKDQSYLVWPVRGSGAAVLPATGQTRCHDAGGRPVACGGSGQDAETRHGVTWPTPRFTADRLTVVDRLTGLRWSRHADLAAGPVSWEAAISLVARLNHAERDSGDWRLPNINELESLVDAGTHQPALPAAHPFTHLQEEYWSSTTSLYEPSWAWALYLAAGAVGVGQKTAGRFHVWAVQGSPVA